MEEHNLKWGGGPSQRAALQAEARRAIYVFFFIFLLFSMEMWGDLAPPVKKVGGGARPPWAPLFLHLCLQGESEI